MITLYYATPACSMASHIALEESGLNYEAKELKLSLEKDRNDLLAINPKGKIPTAIFDGKILTESLAILWHLGTLSPNEKLLPEDSFDRAKCLSLLSWFVSTLHPAFRASFKPEKISSEINSHESIRKKGREDFFEGLKVIDSLYADTKFIVGNKFSIADTYPIVFYNWALIADYPVETLENYTSFKNRIIHRPSVRAVLEREGCTRLDLRY